MDTNKGADMNIAIPRKLHDAYMEGIAISHGGIDHRPAGRAAEAIQRAVGAMPAADCYFQSFHYRAYVGKKRKPTMPKFQDLRTPGYTYTIV
jgi:hypothetical protein